MEKPRRNIEENNRISITCISVLSFALVSILLILIYILYSKSEINRQIKSANEEIIQMDLETTNLNEEIDDINIDIESVSDPEDYVNNLRESYETNLPQIEKQIKISSINNKVAYLTIVVDESKTLQSILETINNNEVLATFFVTNVEDADAVSNNGDIIGLYLNDKELIDDFDNNYLDIKTKYFPNMFMLDSALREQGITINGYKEVVDNSTSEGIKLLTKKAYADNIIETTADREFLIIKINSSNKVGVDSLERIIQELKNKNYMFLPLVSTSSLLNID